MKIAGCGGKQQWFYQQVASAGWGFSRDLLDQKSKSPLFLGAGGHGYICLVHNVGATEILNVETEWPLK